MEPNDDWQLLNEFAQSRSEQAFEALVRRYVDLVYSAAVREAHSPASADEITQATFIILAQKAGRIRPGVFLPSWLLRTVHFAAMTETRTARRRKHYEKEAQMEFLVHQEGERQPTWEELAPFLDAAVASLKEQDRQAVVLRFYKNQPLNEVAKFLEINEDAAQKRVARAVQRLRSFFVKRGLPVSAASLTALISANAVQAAPARLLAAATLAKGATITGSLAAMTKATLKMMSWAQLKVAALVGAGAILAGSAFVALTDIRSLSENVRAQVIGLIATNSWDQFSDQPEMSQLVKIGPQALPVLGDLLEWEPEVWARQSKEGRFLPETVRPYLENPELRREMQKKAVRIIEQLGAAAARPLTSKLCHALDEPVFKSQDDILRALYWSIPESPMTVGCLSNYLADPTHGFSIFGTTDANEIWPKIPQFAPQLIKWLSNETAVIDAASALACMGTNAQAAIPALIEVTENGVLGTPLDLEGTMRYSSPLEPTLGNRQFALNSLGRIGIPTPEVIEVLKRGVADESLRIWALQGLVALRHFSQTRLAQILENAVLTRSYRTETLIESIGQLGPEAEWALPWLERYTSIPFLSQLKEPDPEWRDVAISPASVRRAAVLAICQIQPTKLPEYISDLTSPVAVRIIKKLLPSAKANSSRLQSALVPLLDSSEGFQRLMAAEVLVEVVPKDERAWSYLRNLTRQGSLSERIRASSLLHTLTGETNNPVALIREGLRQSDADTAQTAIQALLELDYSESKTAIPDLKKALWHKDWRVRKPAGQALRKIAHEEMPPIQ